MSVIDIDPVNITGLGLREAMKLAEELGCRVWGIRRTGEYAIKAPDGRRVRCNGRRKDCNRNLTVLLRSLLRERGELESDTSDNEPIELDTETLSTECVELPFDEVLESLDTPVFVPEKTPPPPTSILDRAALFRAQTAAIVDELKAEYEKIDNERDEVLEMLTQVSEARDKLKAELKSFGAWEDSIAYDSPISNGTPGNSAASNKEYIPVKDRPEITQRVRTFLQARRGVWFTPAEICRQCGVDGNLVTVINPLLGISEVEKRGDRRATMYRCPAL